MPAGGCPLHNGRAQYVRRRRLTMAWTLPLCAPGRGKKHLRKHALMRRGQRGLIFAPLVLPALLGSFIGSRASLSTQLRQFLFLSDCPCPRCSCPPSSDLPSSLFLSPFSGTWPSRKEEEEGAATTTITGGPVPKLPSVSEGIRRMEGRKSLFGRWSAFVLAIPVKAAIQFTTDPCLFEGRFDCSNV